MTLGQPWVILAGLVPYVMGGHFIFLKIENAKNIFFVSLILLIITTIDPKKYWATSQTFFWFLRGIPILAMSPHHALV